MFKKIKNVIKGSPLGGIIFCSLCLKRQQRIDRLEEEVVSLKAKLKYREEKNKEEFFGSSTPSSKKKFKKKSSEENKKKQGGAKEGHKGNGRKIFNDEEADELIDYTVEATHCPCCNVPLEDKDIEKRSVIEGEMLKPKKSYLFAE